jgi:hypothetical protein
LIFAAINSIELLSEVRSLIVVYSESHEAVRNKGALQNIMT